jgi:hypothetical protein
MKSSSKYAIVIAIMFVLLVMVFTACGPTPWPTPTPTPTWTPRPPTAPPVPPSSVAAVWYVCADGDGVYIRSERNMEARVGAAWPDGTAMEIIEFPGPTDDWAEVQAPDGYVGYVPMRYLCYTRPAPRCISWTQAAAHIGETTCVSGVVYKTAIDPKSGAFFIDFDNTYTSFYGVSFQWRWDGLTGQCVELYGTISTYNGRPQMVIESKDQLSGCRR